MENLNDKLCTTEAEMSQKSVELSSPLEVSTYILIWQENIMCLVGVKKILENHFLLIHVHGS